MADAELLTTTCPSRGELDRTAAVLRRIGAAFRQIDPAPALSCVAVPALIVARETRADLIERGTNVIVSGWVPYRAATRTMPDGAGPAAPGVCFREATIVVLQPCVADETKIRITAQVHGDLTPVLPYLNAVMSAASFTPVSNTLTYNDAHRMIAVYANRITIAKADEIVDAWLTLARIRDLVEETWARRDSIVPLYETRKRPPAIEIWRRLPGTNCGECGERTCLAFAARLWSGRARLDECRLILLPDQTARRDALLVVCAALGIGTN